jgi:hypothetical protein
MRVWPIIAILTSCICAAAVYADDAVSCVLYAFCCSITTSPWSYCSHNRIHVCCHCCCCCFCRWSCQLRPGCFLLWSDARQHADWGARLQAEGSTLEAGRAVGSLRKQAGSSSSGCGSSSWSSRSSRRRGVL